MLTYRFQAHLRYWGRAKQILRQVNLLLNKSQDLLCYGDQQPGQAFHSLHLRKLDPNTPGHLSDKLLPGVGAVRRRSVITPTPPPSPTPTLPSGDSSGLGEADRTQEQLQEVVDGFGG